MVAFYPHFVSCSETATIKDVVGKLIIFIYKRVTEFIVLFFSGLAAHINHIRDVAGIDYVGIGAGYDGVNL
jgi:membrane dipeptidase